MFWFFPALVQNYSISILASSQTMETLHQTATKTHHRVLCCSSLPSVSLHPLPSYKTGHPLSPADLVLGTHKGVKLAHPESVKSTLWTSEWGGGQINGYMGRWTNDKEKLVNPGERYMGAPLEII